ncbi:MAG: imidazole glycerol phosphate synthase subunit HisH [Thermomonas sp.]|uniref:imidazole glycerol phosphate synthase subunit HisH n=1 Tax=Thermomonas sp. TaxID=1971895 RepID=UPI001D3354CA|nr:imidazole glycerol phosphate synthase subunit HisH [Thermomonas sp.]MBZ0087723.1 imidazole glycerol phosphate synthase subunit HisH [Thermomonas sp.]
MMQVALIDAGGANLGSVRYALERLGAAVRLVRSAEALHGATRVVLPGVGAAGEGMRRLRAQGLVAPLRALQVPLLGICLGMQLLYEASEEGDVEGLGLLQGRVRKMAGGPGLRVPQMGWNTLQRLRESPLLDGIGDGDHAYFVHGYAAPVTDDCIASCEHGARHAALVQRGRAAGAQFHPERSAQVGARLLSNFLQWNPT